MNGNIQDLRPDTQSHPRNSNLFDERLKFH